MEEENNQQEQQLHQQLDTVYQNLENIEQFIQLIEQQQNINKLEEHLTPEEFSNLNVNVAFALNSMYFSFLKSNGMGVKEHRVNQELNRVKQYMLKIKQTVAPEETQQNKRNFKVDSQVSGRIIQQVNSYNKVLEKQQAKQGEEQNQQQQLSEEELKQIKKQQKEEELKDIWEGNDNKQNPVKSRLTKGSLLPSQGHVNWKDQVANLLK
ncbi:hypothetical protein PPERSA_12990 [Pseudocohnilembus persalinus]|uniref:Nuclear nucleic acid-binding protein C1D n=1 Tax=Pseudocohnilembus persalinus TaxID=266149 RepID=A0A0V0R2A3_PSEPJ|nr:hypothetical protein PPERSA_12990 [Pseudocohnilembus persalinus]|eukprot:KRX08509.1 hypothetical protein PPERSA_12990 [Pseudocohnilembus persalinus]